MSRWNFRLIFRFNNDNFAQTGRFIRLYFISNVFNNTFKLNLTSSFCYNNSIERIPASNHLTFLYYFTISGIKCRTIRYVMSRKNNTGIYIHKTYFCQTTYHNFCRFTSFVHNVYSTEFFKFQACRILSHNTCIGCDIGSRTTGMEGTQRQLCTRLTDRLCSNYPNSLTSLNHLACCKITSITFRTNSLLRFTSQYWTYFNTFNRRVLNLLSNFLCYFFTTGNQQFTCCRMNDIMYRYTTKNTFIQRSNDFIIILQVCTNQSTECPAVFFINNHVMRYVYQTTSQISRISRLQCRIRQTFTGTVGRDKVLQHRKPLLKVWKNGVFNNLPTFCTCLLRFCHQTTHTRQLTNLFFRTTGTRIQHHIYSIEPLIITRNGLHQYIRQLWINMSPNIDHLIVTFIIGNETHVIVVDNLLNFIISFLYQCLFLFRNDNITQVEWQTTLKGHLIT